MKRVERMLEKLLLRDLELQGKRVIMRVDFNVPLDEKGEIVDDTRIKASLPSIHCIIDQKIPLILMSHLGRPGGRIKKELSLAPCARRLGELLGKTINMAPDCIGSDVATLAKNLQGGEILLLENLRFYRAEENPETDPLFAKKLAELADIYVDDAFGAAHRNHSSIVPITSFFPNRAAAGLLMEKEIKFLGEALKNPQRPFYVIIGGEKVSTKLTVLQNFAERVDALFIGGAMAYTFLKAEGIEIGDSLHEDSQLKNAQEIIDECKRRKIKIFLPVDHVVVEKIGENISSRVVENFIPRGFQGADIGPQTVRLFSEQLKKAQTIFWNGPLGICEYPNFAKGTEAMAKQLSLLSAITVVGGGDSIAAIRQAGVAQNMTHVSTGGGAALEYMELGQLPGIEALSSKF